RGHKVAMSKKRKHRGLYVQVDDRQCGFTIKEEYDDVARPPTVDKKAGRRVYSWQRLPAEHDSVPSGRLRLELPESQYGRCNHWADTGRSRVENKLIDVIKEIEHRINTAREVHLAWKRQHEQQLAEQERREAQKHAEWETAMQRARARAVDDYRRKSFRTAMD